MQMQSQVQFVPKHIIDQQNSHSRYTFPKSRQGIQKVQSKAQLDQILRGMFYVQFQSKGVNIPYPYQIEQKTRIKNILSISKLGFTVRCRICTNFLTYSRDIDSPSSMFHLQSFYSEHDHRLTQKRKIGFYDERIPLDYRTAKQKKIYLDLKKYGKSIDDIEKCISQLPINLMQQMRQRVICRHFNISINQFKNIYLKLNSKKQIEFSEFIEDLHKKNYEYRYLPQDLLKENPKITRKYHQPTAFSVNPANHQRKEDKNGIGVVPQINLDAKVNDRNKNLFNEPKGGTFEQPKTKGNFPLIDPNTHQIPKPNITNTTNSQPTGLNGNNPNIPLYKINPHIIDPNNPNLPNVLLIISPSMKQMYRKYGQYIGFDLTFSLIRQQPTHTEKEYLVGVFASKNESFRIVIFGLVITNNQSSMVYKWLFKNFMQIMGKQPQTVITDEQVAIGKALKQLKQQGFYHGHHLLDTFHVLTKFRKAVQSQTFQYLRKLIHAKDKYEYKALFEQCMNQLTSDDEIKVLQDFDYHCEKYCYAHIPPTFVGFGVSDAMNESFHNILKDKIPYEIKYLKAVNIMLPFLQQRNEIGTLSLICEIPFEQKFGFPFLKPYRKIVSDRLFYYLIHQCSKGITHSIILDDKKYENNKLQKIQQEESSTRKQKENKNTQLRNNMEKSKFQIVTKQGICLVWKQKIQQFSSSVHQSQITCDPSTNYWSQYPQMSTYTTNIYPYSQFEPKLPQVQYKWRCICQMQEKAGLCCSHILKVLILRNESLLPYIHPRWFIREENIFQGLKSMMKRETSLKYVANITTDMSNLNRLKSIRLRDKYVSARNNIKKQLQEIVEDKIPSLNGEVMVNDLSRRKKASQIGNDPTSNAQNIEKSKNLIQQQYMQWVSANDETIKLQKQKYYRILQKKRKTEIKRLRRQKGVIKKQGSKFSLPQYVNVNKNQNNQKYVDYVYLKPKEMIDIQGKKDKKTRLESGLQQQDGQGNDSNQKEQQQDDDQQMMQQQYEENSEEEMIDDEEENQNQQNSKVDGNKYQIIGGEHEQSENMTSQSQNENFPNQPEDFDQYFMQHAQLDDNYDDLSKLTYVGKNQLVTKNDKQNVDQYQNWDQFENEYEEVDIDEEHNIDVDKLRNRLNNRSLNQTRQKLDEKQSKNQKKLQNHYNPFKKLTKQQLMMMQMQKPTTTQERKYQKEQVLNIDQDQQTYENLHRQQKTVKKRGRPRIHPVKQKSPQIQSRTVTTGQKKRGRPRKNLQSQQINRLENLTKFLEQGGINYYGSQYRRYDNYYHSQVSYDEQGYGIDGNDQDYA